MGPALDDVVLTVVGHRMRTPLTNIIGYAELLQEDAVFLEQTDFIPDLVRIRRSGEHLLALVDDVMELTSIAAGRVELRVERIVLSDLFERVREALAPLLRRTLVELDLRDGAVDALHTDGERLERALRAGLRHVVALAGQGGVRCEARRSDDGGVIIALSVSGVRLTAAQREALLVDMSQPMVAVDATEPVGLGLVLCAELASVLGGELRVGPADQALRIEISVVDRRA